MQLQNPNFKGDIVSKMSTIRSDYEKSKLLPMHQQSTIVQNDLPSEENLSDQDDINEPIPDPDKGVDEIPELIPDPNQGVMGQVTVISTEANGGGIQINDTPTRESVENGGIFPHKYIFKDIVTDSDVMQKVTLGDAPAAKNIFLDNETAVYSARPPDTQEKAKFLS